jgi:hypothetical protein
MAMTHLFSCVKGIPSHQVFRLVLYGVSSIACGIGCAYLVMKSAVYETRRRLFGKRNAGIAFGVTQ